MLKAQPVPQHIGLTAFTQGLQGPDGRVMLQATNGLQVRPGNFVEQLLRLRDVLQTAIERLPDVRKTGM